MRLETRFLPLVMALLAFPATSPAQAPETDASSVPTGALNTWTFSTDSSNNLVIQDLSSFSSSQGTAVGQTVCLQYVMPCPTDAARMRRRYSLRNQREKGTEWKMEISEATFQNGAMTLPLQVGGVDKGVVQVLSSPGPWTVDLRRIPAAELRAGEGKKWNVTLSLTADSSEQGCWIEVQCPGGGS